MNRINRIHQFLVKLQIRPSSHCNLFKIKFYISILLFLCVLTNCNKTPETKIELRNVHKYSSQIEKILCECYINNCLYEPIDIELKNCLQTQFSDNFGDKFNQFTTVVTFDTVKVSLGEEKFYRIDLIVSNCLNQAMPKTMYSKYNSILDPEYKNISQKMEKAIGLHAIETAQYLMTNHQKQFEILSQNNKPFFVARLNKRSHQLLRSNNPNLEETLYLNYLRKNIFSDPLFLNVDSLLLFSSVPLGQNVSL